MVKRELMEKKTFRFVQIELLAFKLFHFLIKFRLAYF